MNGSTVQDQEGVWLAVFKGYDIPTGEKFIRLSWDKSARYLVIMYLSRSGQSFTWNIIGTDFERSTNSLDHVKSQRTIRASFREIEQDWKHITGPEALYDNLKRIFEEYSRAAAAARE